MSCLFLILTSSLEFRLLDRVASPVTVGSEIYSRIEGEDTHGFYDWLRESSGLIIGLRYDLFRNYDEILNAIREFEYVEVEAIHEISEIVTFYFSTERQFCEDKSGDQFFSGDYIYRSASGVYAMSFDLPDDYKFKQLQIEPLVK